MEKLAGVVILYYPDEQKTLNNILSYAKHLSKIYLVDNSTNPCSLLKEKAPELGTEFVYIHDGENKGIAYRLNQVTEMAIREEYKWLLTMDQDSSFEEGRFEKYLHYCDNYPKDDVASFAINFQPAIWPPAEGAQEVLSTITSGSIVNLRLHTAIGKYNEDLFIDLVDAEYCYKAHNLGYKIVLFKDIVLVHRLGYIQYGRSLKSFKMTPRILHSPIRIYYIVRNGLYMLYKFPNLPKEARKDIWQTISLLKNNVLYHKKRSQVIRNIIRGVVDFMRNKMGKLQAS